MEHFTTPTRAEIDHILGDTLTHAQDAYYADPSIDNRRTLDARLIERCSSAGTSYAVRLYEHLAVLEQTVADLVQRLALLEAQGG